MKRRGGYVSRFILTFALALLVSGLLCTVAFLCLVANDKFGLYAEVCVLLVAFSVYFAAITVKAT